MLEQIADEFIPMLHERGLTCAVNAPEMCIRDRFGVALAHVDALKAGDGRVAYFEVVDAARADVYKRQ